MDENVRVINAEEPYESLATLITSDKLSRVRPYSPSCCIYRVPSRLREVNETAYTPQVVSIGPIHRDKTLKIMQDYKWRFLKDFLRRTNRNLNHYIGIVKEMEEKIRGCYEETFDELSSDEFVTIILVDAVFIVELFLTACAEVSELPVENEPALKANRLLTDVSLDLLLLENQLPFFILEEIWNHATPVTPMTVVFCCYFGRVFDDLDSPVSFSENPEHFVDMVRKLHIHPKSTKEAKPFHPPIIDQFVDMVRKPWNLKTSKKKVRFDAPSVTQLREAGLKFKEKESKSLLDVSYSNGTLEIPKWKINDHTEVKFRNIIAFEQCHCGRDKQYVCEYERLMDYLINTSMDVDLLVKEGIIENWLGDNDVVSTMINKLGLGVAFSPDVSYFADIFVVLNDHCRSSWYKWKANLRQKYFNTPWAFLSFLAALLLLILTVIQTVCSVISTA